MYSVTCERRKYFFPFLATGVNSAVVLDRAIYHNVLNEQDKRSATSWDKRRLIESIKRWGDASNDWPPSRIQKKTKMELLDYARQIYLRPKYKIQKIADKFEKDAFSIKILFLPVSHPELNPI